ncbi:hypothetical protein AGMMS49990_00120 [Endomicrobiia bacterium]|nr:hypothetical protein AGMMS49990_00120 [Endomicrobiia bacterium]
MIVDDLGHVGSCSTFNASVKKALGFIKTNISSPSQERCYEINEDMCAIVETSPNLKKISEQNLEIYRKYINSYDVIGHKSLSSCKEIYKYYKKVKDIAF